MLQERAPAREEMVDPDFGGGTVAVGEGTLGWHLVTGEYPPLRGGVSDYTALVAEALASAGDEVHVWCPAAVSGGGQGGTTVQVHAELGALSPADLKRVDTLLERFPAPRHLLVQWVPHSFGYRSINLGFCLWLWRRARRGDRIELMVHEPFLDLRRGRSAKHLAAAVVQRLMTVVLLAGASKVWVAAPGWADLWRPYALGRGIPFEWLPIPSNVEPGGEDARRHPAKVPGSDQGLVLGHFGTYGPDIAAFLEAVVPRLLDGNASRVMVLAGRGGESFRDRLVEVRSDLSPRIHATGGLAPDGVGEVLSSVDLLLQPYPGGVNARRGSLMAALQNGRPVLTLGGALTEPFWQEAGALAIVRGEDPADYVAAAERLLADRSAREALGRSARTLYDERFHLRRTIEALRLARRATEGA